MANQKGWERLGYLAIAFPAVLHAAEGGGSSMLTPLLPQIVWAIITFAVVFGILAKTAWPVIQEILDERAQRIEESLKAAELARKEAEAERERFRCEVAQERLRLREKLARMEEDIARRRAALLDEAHKEAARVRQEAEAAIERMRKELMAAVAERAVDLALAAAEKLLQRRLEAGDDRRFVRETILSITAGDAGGFGGRS